MSALLPLLEGVSERSERGCGGSSVTTRMVANQTINIKRQVEMRNLTLGSVSAFYPLLEGVSERSERGCGFDGCQVQVLQLNLTTRMVANQTINIKEVSGVRLKCAT